ncbi:MAG: hypothetical protein NTV49_12020 [Kiritimatiellaeota bacterium]|nr:hypothetical protein [Kiritimatiellota bacterium]
MEIKAAWDAWEQASKKRQPADDTIASYRPAWQRFQKWAEGEGIIYLHEGTPARVERYAANLHREGFASRTAAGILNF